MSNPKGFILYKIYYDSELVYLGRTKQPLQDRIRGHLFKKPMHRSIGIEFVTKIEYAEFETEADMNVYEVYFINLYRPPLNRDDKARDRLTVSMPPVEWKTYTTPLWEKWKDEIQQADRAADEKRKKACLRIEQTRAMRKKRARGEITEDEYFNFLEGSGRTKNDT